MKTVKSSYQKACATKASRGEHAAQFRELAESLGWTVSVSYGLFGPCSTDLTARYNGYAVSICFNPSLRVSCFLASWHTDCGTNVTYPTDFCRVGSINLFHKRKATTCVDEWGDFLATLRLGFEMVGPTCIEMAP